MGVEEHYSQEHGDGEDGHGVSVELRAASGQVSVADRAVDRLQPMNGSPESGNEDQVTVAAATVRLFPATSSFAGPKSFGVVGCSTADPLEPRIHPAEEEGLLRRAGAGDAAAFREIFVRHRNDVARLVYRMLNAPTDLEDVVQEVFVQVFRSLKDFRGQSKFSTWLHRVTVNVVLMHRRSARSRPVLTEEAPSDVVADEHQPLPDEVAERYERMRAFQRLLARLAEKKRIVFVLHELEGIAPTEIAEIVGAPVLTVRTRLFYARRELEDMLHEEPSLANLRASFTKKGDATTDSSQKLDREAERGKRS